MEEINEKLEANEASKSYVEQMDTTVQNKMLQEQESVINVLKEENQMLKKQLEDKQSENDVESAVSDALKRQREHSRQQEEEFKTQHQKRMVELEKQLEKKSDDLL